MVWIFLAAAIQSQFSLYFFNLLLVLAEFAISTLHSDYTPKHQGLKWKQCCM